MKNNLRIFLISGKANSGKNTVADYIQEYYNKKNEISVITAFAKYIKLYAKELVQDWDKTDEGKSRTLLQDIGSIVRDEIFNDVFFVNRMIEDIKIYNKFVTNVIVADIRLPKEIDNIKASYPNVYALNIKRPNYESTLNRTQKDHITEIGLDNYETFDYIIENDSDLESLKKKVYNLLGGIK